MKKITIAIEGTTKAPVGKKIASGTEHIHGHRPWVIFCCGIGDARRLARKKTVYPTRMTKSGWHYTRHPLQPKDII